MDEIGRRAQGPGRIYVTGGATALLYGWRSSTVDVDIKLDPEPAGIFEAIARLKDELDVNIELASPELFVPPVPGWRERSRPIARRGPVEFLHFDLLSQALAKLARGYERDLDDVRAMQRGGLVSPDELRDGLERIEPELLRYPGLDAEAFRCRVERFLDEGNAGPD